MLERSSQGSLTIFFKGEPVRAQPNDTVAAALLAAGIAITRKTVISGSSRGPYCLMGVCFECVAVVDGVSGTQTCLTSVRDGMRVEPSEGMPELADT